jgi:hypothetical protein
MKALIYLRTSSRRAIPRIGGFLYNQLHAKYLYGGKPIELSEFNKAAEAVMDTPNLHLGHHVCVRLIEDVPEATKKEATKKEAPSDEPEAPQPTVITPEEQDDLDSLHWKQFEAKHGLKPKDFITSKQLTQ